MQRLAYSTTKNFRPFAASSRHWMIREASASIRGDIVCSTVRAPSATSPMQEFIYAGDEQFKQEQGAKQRHRSRTLAVMPIIPPSYTLALAISFFFISHYIPAIPSLSLLPFPFTCAPVSPPVILSLLPLLSSITVLSFLEFLSANTTGYSPRARTCFLVTKGRSPLVFPHHCMSERKRK